MTQRIGSARSSYGNASPGDQSGGKEVSTQGYYDHGKGWNVLICTVAGADELIAEAMEKACANDRIGYDQPTRNTLHDNIKAKGFDPSETTKKVNTDCSALVRVCIKYAFAKLGISCDVPDFTTGNQMARLKATGYFKQLESKYEKGGRYLPRGAILVTKTKGHTAVVLDRGAKCDINPSAAVSGSSPNGELFVRTIKYGMEGADVKALQEMLIKLGYDCGAWGVDGEYGDSTRLAVIKYQGDHDLVQDGIAGEKTVASLKAMLDSSKDSLTVFIYGGNCNIREFPDKTSEDLGTCKKGTYWTYAGDTSKDGWIKIFYAGDECGWVSPKYGRLA